MRDDHNHDAASLLLLTGQLAEELEDTTDPVRAAALQAQLAELDKIIDRLATRTRADRSG